MNLRPCPFCGSLKAEHIEGSYEVDGVRTTTRNVTCGNCNAMGPDTLFGEEVAAMKWNRRRARRLKPNTQVSDAKRSDQ